MTETSPTINSWLASARQKLKSSGIKSYHLDALMILEYVTKRSRENILGHAEQALDNRSMLQLRKLLKKRESRIPIAYIVNSKEFYGRNFYIDERVLIPRPESESFIHLLEKNQLAKGTLIDVGCGSGILGITAKLEAPKIKVTLSDISNEAVEVAANNAKQLGADVTLKRQSLFNEYYDVVLANLPYVPNNITLEKELSYEPKEALFAQNEGLKIYEDFCRKVEIFKPTHVLTECLLFQQPRLIDMFKTIGYRELDKDGLAQYFSLIR